MKNEWHYWVWIMFVVTGLLMAFVIGEMRDREAQAAIRKGDAPTHCIRFVDEEYGVVCYQCGMSAVSCVKVK